MILIYYQTWIYQCPIIQVKSPSIYMVSRPGLGSDPPIGSDRDSGRDSKCTDHTSSKWTRKSGYRSHMEDKSRWD